MTGRDHGADTRPGAPRHESSDAPPRNILVFTGGVMAALLGGMLVTWWLFRILAAATAPAGGVDAALARPPEPHLQEKPAQDLGEIRAAEALRLSSNGWVDRGAGVVHIPIERAMDLVIEEAAGR